MLKTLFVTLGSLQQLTNPRNTTPFGSSSIMVSKDDWISNNKIIKHSGPLAWLTNGWDSDRLTHYYSAKTKNHSACLCISV